MTLKERALLQEKVKTLVLGYALGATLERFAEAAEAAGRNADADLSKLEDMLLVAAHGLADRTATQKLAVLVAVEDVSTTVRSAFAIARAGLADLHGEAGAVVAA